jgi:hypothetical protein
LNLEALEHLFFDVSDVSELPPTSHITVVKRAFDLYDKLFHQPQLIRVFFSETLFANARGLFLRVLGLKSVTVKCWRRMEGSKRI